MLACLIAGNEFDLAKKLGVPHNGLVCWLLGEAPVPPDVFLRAVDIVLENPRKRSRCARTIPLVHQRLVRSLRERHR